MLADFEMHAERFIDAGEEDVVVLARYRGTGRESGVPVEGEQGHVWTVREGLAVRFLWFGSHQEALDAAGVTDA
jgi:ketosteroid isomerase-like protein